MKFGVADYGMNVWAGGSYDFEARLEDLRAIGYNGTERLECIDAADAMYKAAAYKRMGMDFATCRGPNPETTIRFSAALGLEYVWLAPGDATRKVSMETFLRRSKCFVAAAAKFGLKSALHNHLGSRIENQEELDLFMKECPGASLLLDIGHLYGAGGDVLGTIDKYFDRIAAVHFKDVFIKDANADLEHWSTRLRFCELGAGNCNEPWKEAAELLKKRGYDKWVLVEHDTHLREPVTDLKISLDALKEIFC
ncbi:MAG: TIM barrel protein [Lentisphaeria bacterium]|nr:TIM barrel protein [Lentisphaeria bacterium]